MRTLKKTLCLVLALVMVLGLCVTSVSAYDAGELFTDYDQVKHEEAVQVLSMIGVVNGNGDGTLTPGKTLTRAEMAALIMQLMGGADGSYVAAPTFSDTVDAPAWVRKAIGFCQAQGIMSGYGDGTVGPYREVTGYEVASMMLRIIGYDMAQAKQDAGGDWTFATYKYVKQIDLDAGLTGTYETYEEYALGAPMPRDDAFQMVFNTLKATMVEYLPTSISGLPSPVDKIGNRDYDGINTKTCEVIERYYPKVKVVASRDQFQRPGVDWTYGTDKVNVPDTPVKTYLGDFTEAEAKKYSVIKPDGSSADLQIYYNGNDTPSASDWKAQIYGTPGTGLWYKDTAAAPVSSGIPGYEVEIYEHRHVGEGAGASSCKLKYDVIVREAYVAQIKTPVDKKGEIALTVYGGGDFTDADTEVATKYNYTLKKPTDDSTAYYVAAYNKLAQCKKGDIVALYVKSNGWGSTTDGTMILDIAVPETVSTIIKRVDDNRYKMNSTLTTDDGVYKVNSAALWTDTRNSDNVASVENPNFNNGDKTNSNNYNRNIKTGKATLYTLHGTALFIDQSAADEVSTTGYAYLYDTYGETGWETEIGGKVYKAKLYLEDGEQHIVDVTYYSTTGGLWTAASDLEADNATATDKPFYVGNGGVFVRYKIDNSGDDPVYLLEVADNNGLDKAPGTPATNKRAGLGTTGIKKGVSKGTVGDNDGSGSVDVAFDSATTFYVVTGAPNKEKVEVVTGIGSIPTYDSLDTSNKYNGSGGASNLVGLAAVGYRTNVTNTNVVQAMVLRNPSNTGGNGLDDTIFVVGAANTTHIGVYIDEKNPEVWYYLYKAVVGGEITTYYVNKQLDGKDIANVKLLAKTSVKLDAAALKAGYKVIDADGISFGSGDVDSDFKTITSLNVQDVKNDTLIMDKDTSGSTTNFTITDGMLIFKYDVQRGTVEKIGVSDLEDGMTGYYVLKDNSDTDLAALYVTGP